MPLSKFAILVSLAAGTAMVLPALAVQDQPVTIGGVETVCTGVGSAKDNPAWSAYPVKLVFANSAGEDLAAIHVAIVKDGDTVMETDCDAPWLLVRAPAGSYSVTATVAGQAARHATAQFSTNGAGAQKTVTLTFPTPRQQASI